MKKSVLLLVIGMLFSPLMVQAEGEEALLEQELKNIAEEYYIDSSEDAQIVLDAELQVQYLNSPFEVSVLECQDTFCTVSLSLKEQSELSVTKKVFLKDSVEKEDECSQQKDNHVEVEEQIDVEDSMKEDSKDEVPSDGGENFRTQDTNTTAEVSVSDGWVVEGENTYYYRNGERVVGFQEIEGETYYFEADGRMYKGILDFEGKKYLLGVKSGKLYRSGLATTPDGKIYYCGSDGVLLLGFQEIDGDTYYFGPDGSMYKGILDFEGKKYLLGVKSGKLYRSGLATTPDGNIYYSGDDGVLLLGFQEIDGDTYYFGPHMYKGVATIEGIQYLFGVKSGKLYRSGLATTPDGNIYYTDAEGKLKLGWQIMDGETYYFGPYMYKGIVEIEGSQYLFGLKSGKLYRSGLATTPDGNIYYTDAEGKLKLGWQVIDGGTYYFGPYMYKGIVQVEGKKYLFGFTSGKLYIGWAKVPNGAIYYTNSSGEIQTGYQTIEGKAYLFSSEGVLQTGWQEIDGKTYYFYADGSRATFISKIAGVRYEFSATGELQYSNVKLIIDVSSWQGAIDWDRLWSSGEIDGVILRIAAGCEQEDAMLANYIENVKRLGIPYGIYIYSYAENYDEGVLYANFTQNVINKYGLNPTLGVYLDLESNSITSYMGVAEYENVVRGFMSVLPNAKVYTYSYYANTALNSDYIRPYITWIANYEVTDRPGNYQGWQYTSSASVPGINGKVDMSIFYS